MLGPILNLYPLHINRNGATKTSANWKPRELPTHCCHSDRRNQRPIADLRTQDQTRRQCQLMGLPIFKVVVA